MRATEAMCVLAAAGVLGLFAATNSAGQEGVLRVYGAEGPAFAVNEAATAFEPGAGVQVVVVSGPPDTWLDRARKDAEVIYSSADFMMARFLEDPALAIVPTSVTPLYMRPAAILVRPKNPLGITDLPDLTRAGVKVMVVSGSGQTGLWEDVAGRTGDQQMVERLRRNIVLDAESSTKACDLWRRRADIDAWITWNIWYRPMRSEASLVEISPEYRIYRRCSVALTARGAADPHASEFIRFLLSPAGRKIFRSWDWSAGDSAAPR